MWVDEHPDRYGPISAGDYAPFPVGGEIHFIQVGFPTADFIEPAEQTACGVARPEDWLTNRMAYPMGGVVTCPACLALAQAG